MQHSLRSLVFAFSHLLPYPKLVASPQYSWETQPLKVMPTQEDTLEVSYQTTCGSIFGGIVLRQSPDGSLRVGILTQRAHVRCSQLLGMQTVKIPYLRKSQFTSVSSLVPTEEPSQLKISPLQNTFIKKAAPNIVQTTFTSNCGKQVGLFLRPEANGLRLGMVEGIRDEKLRCTRTTETMTFRGLDIPKESPLLLDQIEDESKIAPYTLKRIPVQIGHPIALSHEKKYPVHFTRACNEAPIGLVRQELPKNTISLSMLVASYPQSFCAETVQKNIWSQWEEGFFAAASVTVISSSALRKDTNLRLARPLSYQWQQSKGLPSLQLTSYDFCSRNIGIVSRYFPQGLAVGILQEATAKPCNSSLEKVSYAYEWNNSGGFQQDVKPLQLLGGH